MVKKEQGEKILYHLNRTRKAFLVEYTCIFILLVILFISNLKNITLITRFSNYLIGLIIIIIVATELSRLLHRVKITQSKILIINGLIKQSKKHVFMSYITDVDTKQSYLQRILNFGNIHLKSASGEGTLEIKDVDDPGTVMENIDNLIGNHRKV
jgi:membrane protein YdbS with pleckstrin-like domain